MKPPRPNEGVAKHSWGKRRRIAKKTDKGLWKAMDRLGMLVSDNTKADACSWEEFWPHGYGSSPVPKIHGWDGPSYDGDYSEWPVSTIAHNHLDRHIWEAYDYDAMDGAHPGRVANNDRHALKLLRQEIRDIKRRAQQAKGE